MGPHSPYRIRNRCQIAPLWTFPPCYPLPFASHGVLGQKTPAPVPVVGSSCPARAPPSHRLVPAVRPQVLQDAAVNMEAQDVLMHIPCRYPLNPGFPSPVSSAPALPFPSTSTTPAPLNPKNPLSLLFLESRANDPLWCAPCQGMLCDHWHSAKWRLRPPISSVIGFSKDLLLPAPIPTPQSISEHTCPPAPSHPWHFCPAHLPPPPN